MEVTGAWGGSFLKGCVIISVYVLSIEFLTLVRKLKFLANAVVRCDRKMVDGRSMAQLHKPGQQVRLVGLKFPVDRAWYDLKRDLCKLEKRFVLSTKPLKASQITWWGKRRNANWGVV